MVAITVLVLYAQAETSAMEYKLNEQHNFYALGGKLSNDYTSISVSLITPDGSTLTAMISRCNEGSKNN